MTRKPASSAADTASSVTVLAVPQPTCGAVEIANSLWARKGFELDPGYVAHIQQGFGGHAETLDFSSPQAGQKIDHWVSDATHGKIPSIVGGQIPSEPVDTGI